MSSLDNRYMEFRLNGQLYAIPLLHVKEVIQKPEVTPAPNMPSHFEGMMNLRGQILGVFSVRKKLASKVKQEATAGHEVVIVLDQGGTNFGIIVDEVTRVLHPKDDAIRAAPLREGDVAQDYISSVIQTEEDIVLTMDVSKLLEIEKYQKAA